MDPETIRRKLEALRKINSLVDQAKGRQEAALAILQSRYKLSNIKKAKARVAKLEAELEGLEAEAEELLETWERDFGDLL